MQYHTLSVYFKMSETKNPKTMSSVQTIYQVTIYFFNGNRELDEGEEPEPEELDFVHQLHMNDEDRQRCRIEVDWLLSYIKQWQDSGHYPGYEAEGDELGVKELVLPMWYRVGD